MKKTNRVWVNTLIYNEENFIWFAVMSVIDLVDKVVIWDTGSTDKTVDIIKEIIKEKGNKVEFKEVGRVDKQTLPLMRQKMLDESQCDWILLVDGDEVWSRKQIVNLLSTIKSVSKNTVAIFNRTRNSIGDVFHYLPASSGSYDIKGIKGHLNIRLIKKTKDLSVGGQYPLESYINSEGPIEKQDGNLMFADCWYLHTSFLKRSGVNHSSGSLGRSKVWEKGIKMETNELPESFFIEKPQQIKNPLTKRGFLYELIVNITGPFISLKRKFL